MEYMEYLELTEKCNISHKDGTLVFGDEFFMTTEEQMLAHPGDRIILLDDDYKFAVALFYPKRLKKFIYKYGYAKEGCWTIYTRNLNNDSFSSHDFLIRKERYFRVVVTRKDGAKMKKSDYEKANQIVALKRCTDELSAPKEKPYFKREIDKKSKTVNETISKVRNSFSFVLLSDSHYTVNGTWDDTVSNIKGMAERVDYDAIIHLGDLTDGMLSKRLTEKYVKKIIGDLKSIGKPYHITIGNHDRNYFKNSKNEMTTAQMRDVYEIPSDKKSEYLDYYVDYEDKGLRLIFVESFKNDRTFRYGYEASQIEWLKKTIKSAKRGTKFIIFSHDTPCAKHDAISVHTLNGKRFIKVLEHYNGLNGYKILALFYGHTHADFMYKKYEFPLISENACKLEFFQQWKPIGAVRWYKEINSRVQDSWDSVVIDLDTDKIKMIRFGAGVDREA